MFVLSNYVEGRNNARTKAPANVIRCPFLSYSLPSPLLMSLLSGVRHIFRNIGKGHGLGHGLDMDMGMDADTWHGHERWTKENERLWSLYQRANCKIEGKVYK